jgi:hypothetical protein
LLALKVLAPRQRQRQAGVPRRRRWLLLLLLLVVAVVLLPVAACTAVDAMAE